MKLKKIFLILFFFILIFSLFLFLKSDFWAVKKVDCRQNDNFCSADLWTELISLTLGKNIIFLKTKPLVSRILSQDPTIKEVKVKKKLPSEVVFELKKREAVAAIVEEATFFIVDKEGVIISKTANPQPENLPLIFVNEPINLREGEKFNTEEIVGLINLLNELRLYLFQPRSARLLSSQNGQVNLKNGEEVLFSLKKELKIQLDSLQLIFSRSKIEGRNIKRVDLRFDKPVVTYE